MRSASIGWLLTTSLGAAAACSSPGRNADSVEPGSCEALFPPTPYSLFVSPRQELALATLLEELAASTGETLTYEPGVRESLSAVRFAPARELHVGPDCLRAYVADRLFAHGFQLVDVARRPVPVLRVCRRGDVGREAVAGSARLAPEGELADYERAGAIVIRFEIGLRHTRVESHPERSHSTPLPPFALRLLWDAEHRTMTLVGHGPEVAALARTLRMVEDASHASPTR